MASKKKDEIGRRQRQTEIERGGIHTRSHTCLVLLVNNVLADKELGFLSKLNHKRRDHPFMASKSARSEREREHTHGSINVWNCMQIIILADKELGFLNKFNHKVAYLSGIACKQMKLGE